MAKRFLEQAEKLLSLARKAVKEGPDFTGSIEDVDCYNLLCKAAESDKLYRLLGADFCIFRTTYEDKPALLLVFSLPVRISHDDPSDPQRGKHVSERSINILEMVEEALDSVDRVITRQANQFVYLIMIRTKKS